MSLRSWVPCVLALAVGCATGNDATAPAHSKHAAGAEADDEADAPTPAKASDDEAVESSTAPVAKAAPSSPSAAPAAPEPKRGEADEAQAAEPPRRSAADPFGDVGFKEVNQKDWVAGLRETIAKQEKVPPTDLRVSPGLLRAAYVRSPAVTPVKPGRRAPPRRHEIVVVDNQGRRVATFRAVPAKRGDEPPKDLRFLSEERLVYEVVEPPPETPTPTKASAKKSAKVSPRKPAPHASKGKATVKPAPPPPAHVAVTPLPPPRTFVIQPIAARARPIKCVGFHFTFTKDRDRLAFVTGTAEAAAIAVDGVPVYPRRGRTVVASAPAWSRDGRSLAFLEAAAGRPARLVLLAELDNPTGDTTWDLPPAAPLEGALVFWAGSGKLVVGKTQMRPVFSAAFTKESPAR